MDINKKNRSDLKSYFVKNSIPTESNFAELIDGMLNQKDDGIVKLPGDPLSIETAGDLTGLQKIINFYSKLQDANPAWSLQLNPRTDANTPATAKAGFCVVDGAGSARLFIDKSTGNIGIGTITPSAKLEVNGSFSVSGNAVHSGTLTVTGAATFASNLTVNGLLYAGNSDIYFSKTDHRHSALGNAQGYAAIENATDFGALMILGRQVDKTRVVKLWDYLQINGSLDVTGATALSSTLSVAGVTSLANTLTVNATISPSNGNSVNNGILFKNNINNDISDSAWIRYYARNAELMTLEIGTANDNSDHIALMPSGNVGIGINNPAYTLDVSASRSIKLGLEGNGGGQLILANNTNDNKIFLEAFSKDGASSAAELLLTGRFAGNVPKISLMADNTNISGKATVSGEFYAGNSDIYFTKTDHNHTGIGNTSGYAAIENTQSHNALMILGRQTSSGRIVKIWDYLQVNGNLDVTGRINGNLDYLVSADNRWKLIMQNDRNLVLYANGGGAVWATGTNLSDMTLKKNLNPINGALKKVLSLSGFSFAWKDETIGKNREIGVMAQDVEKVFPELISTISERKFVSYHGLIAVLIEAMKEQQKQIDALSLAVNT